MSTTAPDNASANATKDPSSTDSVLSRATIALAAALSTVAGVVPNREQTKVSGTNSNLVPDTFVSRTCPACENVGLLWIEEDWEAGGTTGHGYLTGVYVAGFECRFCDLELNDFEEFDFLKLNERLSND